MSQAKKMFQNLEETKKDVVHSGCFWGQFAPLPRALRGNKARVRKTSDDLLIMIFTKEEERGRISDWNQEKEKEKKRKKRAICESGTQQELESRQERQGGPRPRTETDSWTQGDHRDRRRACVSFSLTYRSYNVFIWSSDERNETKLNFETSNHTHKNRQDGKK